MKDVELKNEESDELFARKKIKIKAKKKKKNLTIKFMFDDVNMSGMTLRCTVTEILKHLLFQRDQIPMPFSMLEKMKAPTPTKSLRLGLQTSRMSRKEKSIQNLSQIFSTLEKLFDRYNVRMVALMFGSTVVSPKETFLIHCPCTCPGTQPSAVNGSVVRKCLRNIITSEEFNDLASMSSQSIHFLVCLGGLGGPVEDDIAEMFSPRMNYQVQCRGNMHNLYLSHGGQVDEKFCIDDRYSLSQEGSNFSWFNSRLPVKGFKATAIKSK